ncbi:Alpha/beta hydrolase family protein [Melia azedarach]|uniref:Alpha/beta hydrolase family protein n=1 Tax=Melia azedarach TaxID=155640 RepID=A0ACC1XPP4_MELAZ|nr:Alpha/beta hydrolase family protein [Melia azedarach]
MVVLQYGAVLHLNPVRSERWRRGYVRASPLRVLYGSVGDKRKGNTEKDAKKPKICTADELHYVDVSNSDWRLALWRYLPSSQAARRNHPLLLLSGIGTNAIGYDLSPESSFARYMSRQGFDTWILEVRGAGLSTPEVEFGEYHNVTSVNGKRTDKFLEESQSKSQLLETVMRLSEKLSGFLNEVQGPVGPQFLDFQGRLSTSLEDFQKQLDLIVKNNWDFDHYLEEDVPAVMEYIRSLSKPKDGKLLALGHSMGGILLYAMLSRYCFEGKDPGLASVTTLASSLDYRPSKSSLKLLLPLKEPLQTFNVPVIPLGAILAAVHPFASRPPYVLSWLNLLISAEGMMHPELLEKLIFNNFSNIPIKLLSQLTTVFQEGGLRDRNGTFLYKDHLGKSKVPVLALAGDQDLICPPEAVYETVKVIPEHLVSFKVFGEPRGPHYAHYDLVGGLLAAYQVYPRIIEFLTCHDTT